MNVEQALNNFYDQHGYGEQGGINKKWDNIKFGPLALPLPNLESRRKNIYLHDIHHLVTNYDTTWLGESSVSSWEIAAGGWNNLLFPWFLSLWAMAVGVMLYPGRSYQAFRAGLLMNNALTGQLSKEEMLSLNLDNLRNRLQRSEPRKKSYFWWAGLSLLIWWSPLLIGVIVYLLR